MKKYLLFFFLSVVATSLYAQPIFKAGWNSYKTGMIIHEYTYDYNFKDSSHLYLTDSSIIYATGDSLVTLTVNYPLHEKILYKTAHYYNIKKQLIKSEEYKGDELLVSNEWKYDEKNRKICQIEDNKITGKNYKKNYDYTPEKNGDIIITESAYENGRIEFYTKSYYDKNSVKYKEVRLNDNNKDIIHIESYIYGDNGKVKERTVYFPEFKVTKKFDEKEGYEQAKCFRSLPMGTNEKINLRTRITFIKKFLAKVQPVLSDPDCHEFEYKFSNNNNCEIIVKTTSINNMKKLVFRYKEIVL